MVRPSTETKHTNQTVVAKQSMNQQDSLVVVRSGSMIFNPENISLKKLQVNPISR